MAIAVALAIVFAVLIARPIRQLDQAIRQMGTADFAHAIEVNGPQDLRYLGQRLEWLRARLSELEEQQNRFLRHVSHELKTPLTAVREGAELLRDRVGGELSARAAGDRPHRPREHAALQKLIEDLLTYHQTRAMEPARVGPVQLPDVVRRVMREHKLAAFARMITFDAKLAPAMVIGDGEKLRTDRRQPRLQRDQVFAAVGRHPPRPRRQPAASPCSTSSTRATASIRREREHIFDSFYQGKAPVDGRVKGSGLGLAIAREYALAHGGRIEVGDRRDGKRGARFRLMLPLALGTRRSARGGGRTGVRRPRQRDATPSPRGRHVTGRRAPAWRSPSPAARCCCSRLSRRLRDAAPCRCAPQEDATARRCWRRCPPSTPMVEYPPIEPVEPPSSRAEKPRGTAPEPAPRRFPRRRRPWPSPASRRPSVAPPPEGRPRSSSWRR